MKQPPDSWPALELRLRNEPAGRPPAPEFIAKVLRATREESAARPPAPRTLPWPRWGLAGAAAAAALMILLRPTPPREQPPRSMDTGPATGWALSAIEARAEVPLRAEWEGLHGDATRALSFLADCWPSADLAAPSS